MIKIEKNLSGAQMLERLQKGNMVRRSCWVEDFYIRICNEKGFDTDGNFIPQEDTPIYTIATNDYFMHLAFSSQPFAYMHTCRAGEGIQMLFENDWEDYGFISKGAFDKLTKRIKERVRKLGRSFIIALD